jgi:hypothetical protein
VKVLLIVLILADYAKLGEAGLNRAVMLSEAKHLWLFALLGQKKNLRFFAPLRMTLGLSRPAPWRGSAFLQFYANVCDA